MEGVKKMTTFESLEEAQEFFKADRFADINGVQLDKLEDDTCECSMELKDIHKNAYGGVMGGVIFTLGDFAFAVMSNHLHRPTVGQQVSINYLNAPKGEKLTAKAFIKKNGRNSSIINVDISDDTGRAVAQFIGVGFKLDSK